MPGSKKGAAKAKATIYAKYGPDFYKNIGKSGGQLSRAGGFASDKIGPDGLTGRERAAKVGVVGGTKSRRNQVHGIREFKLNYESMETEPHEPKTPTLERQGE